MQPSLDRLFDHLQRPRNRGPHTQPVNGRAIRTREQSGDALRISLYVAEGRIVEIRWQGFGNAVLGACASWLTEHVENKEVAQAEAVSEQVIVAALCVPPVHRYCAEMAVSVLRRALARHRSRGGAVMRGGGRP